MKHNKKYIVRLIISFVSFFYVSCSDYLDVVPDDIATIDNAFADVEEAEKFLYGCYSWMPRLGSLSNNPAFYGGDESYREVLRIPTGGVANFTFAMQAIAIGSQNADRPIADYWSGANGGTNLHRGIRDCNTFLEKIDNVPVIDAFSKRRWVAEAKFLKAYYHFYLFRMYGPIIISDFNLPIDSDVSEIQKFRSPVDECVTYIADLFLEASTDLPAQVFNPVEELGRATKLGALALRARVLTMGASPLFNGNGDYANMIDKNGVSLFPQTYDNEKWRLAAEACKEAIEIIEGAGVQLFNFDPTRLKLPNNVNIDEIPDEVLNTLTIQHSLSEIWTDEKLFVSTKGSTQVLQQHAMARTHTAVSSPVDNQRGAFSIYSPTLRIAEMFYTKRGVPIDEDKDWDYGNRYELRRYNSAADDDFDNNLVPDNKYFVKNNETTINLHFDRETRFYGSLGFDRGIWYTTTTAGGSGLSTFESHYLKARNTVSEWSSAIKGSLGRGSYTGYFAKKLTNYENTINNNGQLTTVNYAFPEIRLADLYLLYAECLNEIDDRATAYIYIDKVRERANLEGVVESWANYSNQPNKPNSKSGFREIVQQERLIELVFEGQRFWDLKRWKLAENNLIRPLRGWNYLGTTAEEYYESPRVLGTADYTFKDNLWPIDTEEILSNPNTLQNGGW
ncbi:RagB/SusD family nutrient uptake outer membrane protein [uncultured Algibacter sp.]|uniref:RagB/SusD family nutrient uptake outer membrane protein n=1 Tax=uncultured Algibacter sp. TaxID=298659 RepID=UPI0026101E1C|nr:RagB/SusD family nutrient uptake outer membrane protein [uncultured Algibacter sp.]